LFYFIFSIITGSLYAALSLVIKNFLAFWRYKNKTWKNHFRNGLRWQAQNYPFFDLSLYQNTLKHFLLKFTMQTIAIADFYYMNGPFNTLKNLSLHSNYTIYLFEILSFITLLFFFTMPLLFFYLVRIFIIFLLDRKCWFIDLLSYEAN